MAGIPPEIIDQIRQSVDIVEVIDAYVPLKRAGANYKALSPFNKEKTPSFFVSPQRQSFKCFSSGHGGDVFKFLMLYEHVDFPTAVRKLAEKANITIPESSGGIDAGRKRSRDRLLTMQDELAARWSDLLKHNASAHTARDYMRSREIPLAWADRFGLGYAPDLWDDTLQWGQSKGYGQEEMVEAGVLVRNEQGRVYDRFRGRLVFPVRNESGQTIAFSARILDPEAKAAKYINSPETPVFTKSKVLFGLDHAKRPILDADQVVLAEGQLDVLRCHAAGIGHVVAPLGTAFTEDHARILRRFTRNIVLCLDADSAGRRAAVRVADLLLERIDSMEMLSRADLGIRVMVMPEGQDPDSLIAREGAPAFLELLGGACEYIDFLIQQLEREHDPASSGGRRMIVEGVAGFLARIPNAAHREHLAQKAATRLELGAAALEEEIRAQAPRKRIERPSRPDDNSPGGSAPPVREMRCHPLLAELLRLLIGRPESLAEIQRGLAPDWFRDLPGAVLLERVMELYAHEEVEAGDLPALMSRVDEAGQNFLAGLDYDGLAELPADRVRTALVDMLRGLELDWINRETRMLSSRLKDHALPAGEKTAVMRRQTDLLQRKKSLTG